MRYLRQVDSRGICDVSGLSKHQLEVIPRIIPAIVAWCILLDGDAESSESYIEANAIVLKKESLSNGLGVDNFCANGRRPATVCLEDAQVLADIEAGEHNLLATGE